MVDRNRKILDTAAELFYEKGFHGTSMDELGTRAGMSGPAVYRHFAGKDEILASLFGEAMDELLAATEPSTTIRRGTWSVWSGSTWFSHWAIGIWSMSRNARTALSLTPGGAESIADVKNMSPVGNPQLRCTCHYRLPRR